LNHVTQTRIFAFCNGIVTGQKRDTTLQESDLSVTVLYAETIRETAQFNESGQLSSVFVTICGIESNPFIVNRAAIYAAPLQ
jgi:iron complex outermembrane recepter protein